MPFPLSPEPPRPSRSRLTLVLSLLGAAACVALGLLVLDLRSQLAGLREQAPTSAKSAQTPVGAGGSGVSTERAPAGVPAGPRGATLLILGCLRDREGRVVLTRELGAGVAVAALRVATTRSVAEHCRDFVKAGTAGGGSGTVEILAAPSGILASARVVTAFTEPTSEGPGARSLLALLECDPEGAPLARVLLHEDESAAMTATPPGQPTVTLSVQGPAEGPDVLRLTPLPRTPGMPLFVGDAVAALTLGAAYPDQAARTSVLSHLLAGRVPLRTEALR